MSTNANSPIGVFDSGIGGLTVVRALMERLPYENIVYFGDTARVPYGVKSVETIAHFTTQIAQFLLEKDVKLLVIACNTMAAVAAQVVKDLSPVPVLDVIDAGAVSARGGRKIGVIGTPPPSTATPTRAPSTTTRPTRASIRRPARCSFRWSRKAGSIMTSPG